MDLAHTARISSYHAGRPGTPPALRACQQRSRLTTERHENLDIRRIVMKASIRELAAGLGLLTLAAVIWTGGSLQAADEAPGGAPAAAAGAGGAGPAADLPESPEGAAGAPAVVAEGGAGPIVAAEGAGPVVEGAVAEGPVGPPM